MHFLTARGGTVIKLKMEFLREMQAEKFLEDPRDIMYELSIPGIGRFGLAPPLLLFWVQLGVVGGLDLYLARICRSYSLCNLFSCRLIAFI
jgi:hypothetical protein